MPCYFSEVQGNGKQGNRKALFVVSAATDAVSELVPGTCTSQEQRETQKMRAVLE